MFRDNHPIAWAYHDGTVRAHYNMHGLAAPTYEVPPFKEDSGLETKDLPAPVLPANGFDTTVRARLSCRQFRVEPVSLQALSTLLFAGYGILDSIDLDGEFMERPVPSGGALYPLELYVLAQNIAALTGGVWHYVPLGHRLELVHPYPLPRLFTAEMFLGQSYLADCAAIVMITSIAERSMWKYEDRGYRYILLEAGHVAQNLNLCATAMGLGCLNLGGFFDRDILGLIGAEPDDQIALYGVAVGHPKETHHSKARRPNEEDVAFRRY